MNQAGKVNTLFLCILGVSIFVHIVALAYVKLPDIKQVGPLTIQLVMKQKPRPRPKPPEPKPEPKPQPKPKPKPVQTIQKSPRPPAPRPPDPEQDKPPVPLKPPEPDKGTTIAPVAPQVVEAPQGASETGSPHGLPGGVPGGKGREPVAAPVQPAPPAPEPEVDIDALWRQYAIKVITRIQNAKQYPPRARRQGVTGAASVRFTVSASGSVSGVSVSGSSGYGVLDEEAVNAVHRAAPFPPIPKELNASSKSMSVTLKFEIR